MKTGVEINLVCGRASASALTLKAEGYGGLALRGFSAEEEMFQNIIL